MGEKKRLDLILTDRGFFNSRQISRTNIMCGNVLVDGIKVFKPGEKLDENVKIEIIGKKENLYVSRAGVKLKKAIDEFGIDLKNKICFTVNDNFSKFPNVIKIKAPKSHKFIRASYEPFGKSRYIDINKLINSL